MASTLGGSQTSPSHAEPSRPASGGFEQAPEIAVFATQPGSGSSSLYFVQPGGQLPSPSATLSHLPGGSLRARVVDPALRTLVVNARSQILGDGSFDYGTFLLEPGEAPRLLCDEVVHASRPLVDPQGAIYVVRGEAGAPNETSLRLDALHVDRVELDGSASSIHGVSGHHLHLAGWHAGRLLVYRVLPGAADIVALDPDDGSISLLANVPPFARDFSIDHDAELLIYRGRHEQEATTWVVDSLDLSPGNWGAHDRLYQSAHFSLAPSAWPDGGLAINPARQGMTLIGSADVVEKPLGPGVDVVEEFSLDQRFGILTHFETGRVPAIHVIDRSDGDTLRLPLPIGMRPALAGFVEVAP